MLAILYTLERLYTAAEVLLEDSCFRAASPCQRFLHTLPSLAVIVAIKVKAPCRFGSRSCMEPGDWFLTKHSALWATHLVFHLVVEAPESDSGDSGVSEAPTAAISSEAAAAAAVAEKLSSRHGTSEGQIVGEFIPESSKNEGGACQDRVAGPEESRDLHGDDLVPGTRDAVVTARLPPHNDLFHGTDAASTEAVGLNRAAITPERGQMRDGRPCGLAHHAAASLHRAHGTFGSLMQEAHQAADAQVMTQEHQVVSSVDEAMRVSGMGQTAPSRLIAQTAQGGDMFASREPWVQIPPSGRLADAANMPSVPPLLKESRLKDPPSHTDALGEAISDLNMPARKDRDPSAHTEVQSSRSRLASLATIHPRILKVASYSIATHGLFSLTLYRLHCSPLPASCSASVPLASS